MDLIEFKEKCKDEEWTPGWSSIDEKVDNYYNNQELVHYGTLITSRASLGGNEYLDGYSFYKNEKGYLHCITYGMSELYQNESALNKEYSKWGYEMTLKFPEENNYNWAMSILSQLARYTNETSRYFEANQFVEFDTSMLVDIEFSNIKGFLTTLDTELKPIDTIYGKVEFIQLVAITQKELDFVKENKNNVKKVLEKIKKENKDYVIDLRRNKDYL